MHACRLYCDMYLSSRVSSRFYPKRSPVRVRDSWGPSELKPNGSITNGGLGEPRATIHRVSSRFYPKRSPVRVRDSWGPSELKPNGSITNGGLGEPRALGGFGFP
jgi:hypothetical protein